MNELSIVFIFWLFWLLFWSFWTVLIDRWHKNKNGIFFWRSECPSCRHILGVLELIPLFSYIIQWGKCRNCKKKISIFYPLAEISMFLIFAIMSSIALRFWYTPIDGMWYIFLFWWFITGIYILYDIRYMEIPDQIMIPAIFMSITFLSYTCISWNYLLYDFFTYQNSYTFLTDHVIWAITLYSFLFIQILIPWGFFLIKRKRWEDLIGLLLSYFIFPITLFIEYIKPHTSSQNEEALPSWVGGGDLRIAIFIGITLWSIHGIASFIFAYILWSFFWIISIIIQLLQWEKSPSRQMPFWPFLWAWWILSLLFYNEIISYIMI